MYLLWFLLACNDPGFKAVTITPIYGWVDGCTSVTVRGHGFAENATANIGDQALNDLSYPDAETKPLDVGYQLYGRTPPATEKGYADVSVTSNGETSVIPDAFYYVACLADAFVEGANPTEAITSGSTVTLYGCNLDANQWKVKVGDAEPVAMTSSCSTAEVTFTAPDLADGSYAVSIVDSAGNTVFPVACDSADTGVVCTPAPILTYGSAQ